MSMDQSHNALHRHQPKVRSLESSFAAKVYSGIAARMLPLDAKSFSSLVNEASDSAMQHYQAADAPLIEANGLF